MQRMICVQMLGPLCVEYDGMFVTWFQTKKNALTLAMLAGEGRSLCRAWLNEQIWPESNRNDERRNLRVALTWLRKNLPVL